MRIVTLAFAVLVALVAIPLVWVLTRTEDIAARCGAAQVAGSAIGGPFTLVDETGATVTSDDVIDAPTLVYFGYTFCPDVCPLDAMRNAQAADLVAEQGGNLQTVFVSVDPARDTPEVMAAFTDNFSDDMIGLTGSAEQVDAAAKAYKVFYQADDPEEEDWYLVQHTSLTYLVEPGAGVVDYFNRTDPPEVVASRALCRAGA